MYYINNIITKAKVLLFAKISKLLTFADKYLLERQFYELVGGMVEWLKRRDRD